MYEISTQESQQTAEKVTVANYVRAETDHMFWANMKAFGMGIAK